MWRADGADCCAPRGPRFQEHPCGSARAAGRSQGWPCSRSSAHSSAPTRNRTPRSSGSLETHQAVAHRRITMVHADRQPDRQYARGHKLHGLPPPTARSTIVNRPFWVLMTTSQYEATLTMLYRLALAIWSCCGWTTQGTKARGAFVHGFAVWVQSSLNQKQRLQQLLFPEGVRFDGKRLVGTGLALPVFSDLGLGS